MAECRRGVAIPRNIPVGSRLRVPLLRTPGSATGPYCQGGAARARLTSSLKGHGGRGQGLTNGFPQVRASRNPARAIGNDEAPGLFTEGFYRYSVLSTSLNATNQYLNLLAQQFIFRLRDLA
jgi:hypothetical protein